MRYRLITSPRTKGTHALNCLIHANNPDQYKISGELYNEPYNHSRPQSSVQWMLKDNNCVVKHHIRHLVAEDVYPIAKYFELENTVEWNTIVLLRRNLFEQSLSYARSRMLNQWSSYTDSNVTIDTHFFENCVLALWGSVVHTSRNIHRLNYNKVLFSEDLVGDNQQDTKLMGIETLVEKTQTTVKTPANTVNNIQQLHDFASTIQLPQYEECDITINSDLIITSFNWNK